MPMDEPEMDRIDMAHAKYFLLLEKRRFLAPIPEDTQRVLDLGTGTGLSLPTDADSYKCSFLALTRFAIRVTRNLEY
jgi:hypothetical protein